MLYRFVFLVEEKHTIKAISSVSHLKQLSFVGQTENISVRGESAEHLFFFSPVL